MVIEISNLTKSFKEKKIFENFSYNFSDSMITAIIAPSGSGKTTLLNMIAKVLPQDFGIIDINSDVKINVTQQTTFDENSSNAENNYIDNNSNSNINNCSYLFQEPRLIPWLTIEKNISIVLENIYSKTRTQEIAKKYLHKINLINRSKDLPSVLSGGEKQRVAIARAFAFPSKVLLLDEAFQSQDLGLRIKLMETFYELFLEQKRTTIMVTHDVREAFALADKILVLQGEPLKIVKEIENKKENISVGQRYLNPTEDAKILEKNLLDSLYN